MFVPGKSCPSSVCCLLQPHPVLSHSLSHTASAAVADTHTHNFISWPSTESKVINLGLRNGQLGTLLAPADCREKELLENLDRKKCGREKQYYREEIGERKKLSVKSEQLQRELQEEKEEDSPKIGKNRGAENIRGSPSAATPFVPVCPLLAGVGHSSTLTP